ncbi:MAG: ABC transporter permease [Acidimicrobiia bacterium]|nr:ABC transporter permease [Acidimicrobiia bacterium]
MTVADDLTDGPPPELRFRRRVSLVASIRAVWAVRELVRTLAERDLRARYKQAVLGFAWAVVPTIASVVLFTVLFDRVAEIDTGGATYALFAYFGVLTWSFFSNCVNIGGNSLVGNVAILNKVACPREVFPLTAVVTASVDWLVAAVTGVLLFLVLAEAPHVQVLWLPVYLALQLTFTIGVVLLLSSVIVFLRDLRHALPLLLQLGLFATPVVWNLRSIQGGGRVAYAAFNPLGTVIDGLRSTALLGHSPDWQLVGVSTVTSVTLLFFSYWVFKRLEPGIADVA